MESKAILNKSKYVPNSLAELQDADLFEAPLTLVF
jgi:hypothetical protein